MQYFCKVKKSLQSQEKICNRYKLNIEKTAFLLFLAEMRRFYSQDEQYGLQRLIEFNYFRKTFIKTIKSFPFSENSLTNQKMFAIIDTK